MDTSKRYLFIFASLLISLIVAVMLSNVVFEKNTPSIKPGIGTNLIAGITSLFSNKTTDKSKVNSMAQNDRVVNIANNNIDTALKTVSKGVYAAQDKQGVTQVLYKVNEVDWVEYTFNIKGKEIKVRVPKGQSPPPQASLEIMY